MAPGMPAMRNPISTDPSTTTGWIPTVSRMIRGWRMFITTNQPTTIATNVGPTTSGLNTRAARIGGVQARNGPKNGMAIRTPATTEVRATSGSPRTTLVDRAMRK